MAHQQSTPREAFLKIGGKSPFALELVHAPGDIEDQSIGFVERDGGRIALASIREPLEPFVIGMRIVIVHFEFRNTRPRIGER